jgi:hypothetical protein
MTCRFWVLILVPACVAACSSSPYNPVNQTTPVRQMDSFFSGGRTDYPPPQPGYNDTPPPNYGYQRGYDTGSYSRY